MVSFYMFYVQVQKLFIVLYIAPVLSDVDVLPVYDCDIKWLLGMMFEFIFHIFL